MTGLAIPGPMTTLKVHVRAIQNWCYLLSVHWGSWAIICMNYEIFLKNNPQPNDAKEGRGLVYIFFVPSPRMYPGIRSMYFITMHILHENKKMTVVNY